MHKLKKKTLIIYNYKLWYNCGAVVNHLYSWFWIKRDCGLKPQGLALPRSLLSVNYLINVKFVKQFAPLTSTDAALASAIIHLVSSSGPLSVSRFKTLESSHTELCLFFNKSVFHQTLTNSLADGEPWAS